ncbi:MAG: error-prone DNA polymerase [Euryhalocaulis sp.]|uniref:error-prone DNA polymerase n=1 Tax=Euryhalocaulis sp. TaxID=2744307 RepID=UPI0017A666CF|nr:error-prone DNA polymerase [Euryhalocaulis sp.]MBA4800800.1 error-prone DNA polymerase [Euryhalocaulis sp.]
MTPYAELLAATNFSFLRGASHPDEMIAAAKALGIEAIGVCDRNSLAGVVRAHRAAKDMEMRFHPGARLVTQSGFEAAAYPTDLAAYGRLTRLLTLGKRRAPKGDCHLEIHDILDHAEGLVFLLIPPADFSEYWAAEAFHFIAAAPENSCHIALVRHFDGRDGERLHRAAALAEEAGAPAVAATDALYHSPDRRALQDVITCIREKTTIDAAGYLLERNAERHLKDGDEMARLLPDYRAALARSLAVADRLKFSLDEIAYQYPEEVMEPGETPMETLTRLTREGLEQRYPEGAPDKVTRAVEYELALIEELNYPAYFLTVHDLVRYARSQGILCQGRGSAANSSVCYCLGVTSVDPATIDLLFERFVSAERGEPPDIDVDFEHERREEVIQYIYEKYGRHRAGMTATVTTYRAKGAVREVGKAMGLSLDMVDALARSVWGWSPDGIPEDRIRELSLDPDSPRLKQTLKLTRDLMGFPRHLSQHPGGFVITRDRLDEIVPVMNAAMADRTCIEWDKEDIEALGLMKVDVLGMGMLSVLAKAFALMESHYGRRETLASLQDEDPRVYDMICEADTVGVFQIESRAQMSMLPRLRPREFYDLVIEVAIVRPGPIQGDMVHPYLRRRDGKESVSYPSKALKEVLHKTLGVPLFQEQAMKIAVVAAGFTPSEADRLRRAMATFRNAGVIHEFGMRLIEGMVANGYDRDFAEPCFRQIKGFGEYGFPESHAASFALLVYVSAWVKRHYPDIFCAAILNSQPMGFYAPAQLYLDAKRHGVAVRPPDVNRSDWDCTLEPLEPGDGARLTEEGGARYAVRLGLRLVKGFSEAAAARLSAARQAGGKFGSVEDVLRRACLTRRSIDQLARGDAFRSIGEDRRRASWSASGLSSAPMPLFDKGEGAHEDAPDLPDMPLREQVFRDYQSLGLSLKAHPISFFRERYEQERVVRCADLKGRKDGTRLSVAGVVLIRQRPGSAHGVVFITLEDETGVANLIVWPKILERYRRAVLGARLLRIDGRLQREGQVIHIVCDRLVDESWRLETLREGDGDFGEGHLSRADEVRNGTCEDPREITARRRADRIRRSGEAASLPKSRDFR